MKIGKNSCNKSKYQRPCIYDLVNYVKLGDDLVNNIYRCRRCKTMHTEEAKLENPKCLISPNGKHSWSFNQNLSFRQYWKYQEVRDLECCDYCSATMEVSYVRDIRYNPHID